MKKNISCEIIQDLLPNYIEGILSNESEKLVSDHLNECIYCKKEWENMNTLIEVDPVEERKVDYLKGIHKKCRNILLSCIALSAITLLICVFYMEKNTDEALFTLFLFFFVFVAILIKYGFPLFFAIAGFWWYKKTNKKWVLVISFICIFLFLNSILSVVKNALIYGP
ncbi:zf-HC2 domain-containing protein [Clostridium sp. MSJ-11]|uniref:Zf-HC2 domain-containing protein n=1 Tax=Clostridium mobile TaxID=2841512 RepID=A0ABS6EDV3_9CLOT|nr:zf-HC2 domain-containing protein [Clostridium mobile]MBU5483327.1 zf-HC2 domain-containing protein [Clostridium mobile]